MHVVRARARLDAPFGIAVTGVMDSPCCAGGGVTESAAITNALLHYVVPVMAMLGWFLLGPRPRIGENVLMFSLI